MWQQLARTSPGHPAVTGRVSQKLLWTVKEPGDEGLKTAPVHTCSGSVIAAGLPSPEAAPQCCGAHRSCYEEKTPRNCLEVFLELFRVSHNRCVLVYPALTPGRKSANSQK